jgi:hypothetical protein
MLPWRRNSSASSGKRLIRASRAPRDVLVWKPQGAEMSEPGKPSMVLVDTLFSLVIIGLGVLIFFATGDLILWDDFGPGPRLVPLITAGVLAIFGAAILLSGNPLAVTLPDGKILRRMGVYVALLVACIVLFVHAGAAVAFMLFFTFELIWVEKYPPWRACLVSAATVAVVYLVFSVALKLRLPPFPYFLT